MATVLHPNGPVKVGFNYLHGVAVDSSTHDVYFSSFEEVRKMAPDGAVMTVYKAKTYNNIGQVAVDSSTHDVYFIAGSWLYRIEPNGSKHVVVVGDLLSVAVDPATHNLYVAHVYPGYANRYGVMKFAPNGETIGCVIGSKTRHDNPQTSWWPCYGADVRNPRGVAVDPTGISGWVYISDTGHNEIKKVDHKGHVTIIGPSSEFYYPHGLAMDRGHDAFVADTGHNEVKEIFGPCSCITARWPFKGPKAVAVDSGTGGGGVRPVIYVAAADGLWKITPSPAALRTVDDLSRHE